MSLKFEELMPVKTLASDRVAQLTNVRVINYTNVRTGYAFNSLTRLEDAPDHHILLASGTTGEELDVWLRLPQGLANPNLNKGVMQDHIEGWIKWLVREAEQAVGGDAVFARSTASGGLFGLDYLSLLSATMGTANSAEDHADIIMKKLLGRERKEKEDIYALLKCYETAPGRRYRIEAELGHGFSFKLKPMSDVHSPTSGALCGTTKIRTASYQFEIYHDVLCERLPLYYGAQELQVIVRDHLNKYLGDFTGNLSDEDLALEFLAVAK